jgi:hypothetical protein
MFLFKAKQKARSEFESALKNKNLDIKAAAQRLSMRQRKPLSYPRQRVSGTAANQVYEL